MKIRRFATVPLSLLLLLTAPLPIRAEKSPLELTAAAEGGDAAAQVLLAKAYANGKGVPKDAAKAFELMRKAAAQNHPDGLGGMGYFYATGAAVEKDEAEAVRWFQKGAERGSAMAQFNLGRMLADGRGVAKNEEEGIKWIRRAAAQNLPQAMIAMGDILFSGRYGLKQDYVAAYAQFLAAATSGDPVAQNFVGVMLRDGSGIAPDTEEAKIWFRKGAVQGEKRAQSNLGHLLGFEGADRVEALKWLFLAEAQGEILAKATLTEILHAMPAADVEKARRLVAESKAAASVPSQP